MDNSKLFGEAANEEQLLKNDYRKYRGENMDIYYNVAICEHAGECVRGNPLVFEVGRKPWIIPDNGDVASNQSVIKVINRRITGNGSFFDCAEGAGDRGPGAVGFASDSDAARPFCTFPVFLVRRDQ